MHSISAASAAFAFKQWTEPTGKYVVELPEGALAWVPDAQSEHDRAIAARLISDQNARGLETPAGYIVIGIPSGVERQNSVEWTKYLLRDGRSIGIASTDDKIVGSTAIAFLWKEQERERPYTDKDQMEFDGVRVTFLKWNYQAPLANEPPWPRHREREWLWPLLLVLCGSDFTFQFGPSPGSLMASPGPAF